MTHQRSLCLAYRRHYNGQDAIILRHSENGFIILLSFAVPWVVIDTDRKTQTKLCILHTISRNMSDSLHLTTNAHDKLYIVPLVYCTWGSVQCRAADRQQTGKLIIRDLAWIHQTNSSSIPLT